MISAPILSAPILGEMSGGMLVGLEMGITFAAVVGWGLWELYKLKKGK